MTALRLAPRGKPAEHGTEFILPSSGDQAEWLGPASKRPRTAKPNTEAYSAIIFDCKNSLKTPPKMIAERFSKKQLSPYCHNDCLLSYWTVAPGVR
jgi:hypothetical protein